MRPNWSASCWDAEEGIEPAAAPAGLTAAPYSRHFDSDAVTLRHRNPASPCGRNAGDGRYWRPYLLLSWISGRLRLRLDVRSCAVGADRPPGPDAELARPRVLPGDRHYARN